MAVDELTEAELRDMAAALGLPFEHMTPALRDYLNGVITEAMLVSEPAIYNAMIAELTGPPSKAAAAAAKGLAENEARKLALENITAEFHKIADFAAESVAKGWHPDELARHLDMVKGLDSQRAARMAKYQDYLDAQDPPPSPEELERLYQARYQKELADRRRVIAQTEQRYATSEGNQLDAKERGGQFKAWMTVGDGRVSDECLANEAEGWIGIDEEFSSGHQHPGAHPRCRCTVAYRKATPDDAAKQRASARAESTKAAKEAQDAQSKAKTATAKARAATDSLKRKPKLTQADLSAARERTAEAKRKLDLARERNERLKREAERARREADRPFAEGRREIARIEAEIARVNAETAAIDRKLRREDRRRDSGR